MLNNLFFTIIFFTLDHFLLMLIFNITGLIPMRFVYKIWRDHSRAPDVRYLSLAILIFLVIMLMLFLMVILYITSMFIIYFHEIGKFTDKW